MPSLSTFRISGKSDDTSRSSATFVISPLALRSPTFARHAAARDLQDDNFYSPRAGIIVKPTDNLSLHVSYSVTHLPASGDQFGSVPNQTKDLELEKYVNKEVGLKWGITPELAFTTAVYEVDRINVRFAQPDSTFIQAGKSEVEGV